MSDNGLYATGLLGSAYEITKQIPLNYTLVKHNDERAIMIKQLNYLKPNDIVVTDREYYSINVVEKLSKQNIKFVMRLKNNSKLIATMDNMNEKYTLIKCKNINVWKIK